MSLLPTIMSLDVLWRYLSDSFLDLRLTLNTRCALSLIPLKCLKKSVRHFQRFHWIDLHPVYVNFRLIEPLIKCNQQISIMHFSYAKNVNIPITILVAECVRALITDTLLDYVLNLLQYLRSLE